MIKTFTTILILFIYSSFLFGQSTQEKLKITHLINDYYVFTTYKDFNGKPFSSNGLYLVTNLGVVMIDTPWDTTQFQPLLDSIKYKHNKNVIICIATHSHEDRTAGLEYYKQKGIKTYTSKLTDSISKVQKEKRSEFFISKDTIFKIGQYSFETFFAGPGHSPDNIVIWFNKEKILYGGCLVKSTESSDLGSLRDANTIEWTSTLKKILQKFGQPLYIITGHQDWTSNKSLDYTIKLLKQNK